MLRDRVIRLGYFRKDCPEYWQRFMKTMPQRFGSLDSAHFHDALSLANAKYVGGTKSRRPPRIVFKHSSDLMLFILRWS